MRGVSLEIPAGAVVGILGPNGAGKSTTIRMITGGIPPTRGSVHVDGMDAIADSRRVRRRLGYLPEANPLYPEMRVADYLAHRAGLYGLRGRERRAAVERALGRCWLSEVRRRRVGHLSKGFRQRVGLAAALVHDPPVLILDEPTSGLDPTQIAETRGLIRELAGDHTMLLVSHILPEVERTCDRIVIFSGGRIVADGTHAELLAAEEGSRRVHVELVDADDPEALLGGVAGVATVAPSGGGHVVTFRGEVGDGAERIGVACRAAGVALRELRAEAVTLETLYVRLADAAAAERAA